MDLSLLSKKFRGSMLGALTGDCLGSPYENDEPLSTASKVILQKSFDKLEGPSFKAPVMQFTDDSAMTKSVVESLIEKRGLDLDDLSKKFVKRYYQEPNRGYGQGIVTVFQKLRGNKFSDLMTPAREQFNGQGSMGNGGAMRVAPIALFCYNDYDQLVNMTKQATQLTHTHKFGVNGAILQAIAVQKSLTMDPKQTFNYAAFLEDLINKMNVIEENDEEFLELSESEIQPFKTQLKIIERLIEKSLTNENEPHTDEILKLLGNNVTALHSVPTAIFCFVRAQYPIAEINTENPMRRAIQYAITLGGDTDTIASMAGAIAGAYYGEDNINAQLLNHCEASAEFKELANKLFDLVTTTK
ncbi:hypothetical protein PV325_001546 [Microctonus aethiopoides]|nr:hypothetical protein PV325_001546 [Microctonus aethiopoides]KAK0097166.1 hypothetical protein PV326_003103 [Microctonus aethiopoides]